MISADLARDLVDANMDASTLRAYAADIEDVLLRFTGSTGDKATLNMVVAGLLGTAATLDSVTGDDNDD